MRARGTATRCARTGRPVLAAIGALVGLVLAVAAAGVAEAQEAATRGIDRVCPVGDATEQVVFDDVGPPHEPAVSCAATYELIAGYGDDTYRPALAVSRAQMATIVRAWVELATGITLPPPDEPRFEDVTGSVHVEAIEALAEAGIVSGYSADRYEPRASLTRGQFAAMVVNAISYADVLATGGPLPPDGEPDRFDDVAGTTFEAEIDALAGIGVTSGVSGDRYLPDAPISRGQLATFLMRSADYLDEHQRWRPTARTSVVLLAELEAVAPPSDDDEEARGSATLTINAFNSTLAFSLDLSRVPGPYAADGATIHLGDVNDDDPADPVLQLADPEALQDATGGVVTGVVVEADSRVRFADLVDAPQDAYVQVATDEVPGGAVRGQLHATG